MSPTPAVGPRHVVGGGDVADRIKLSPPPLDLTNKSPEPPTAGGNDDMAATAAAKLGLENHLNMLKMKEMEMLKTVLVKITGQVKKYMYKVKKCANSAASSPYNELHQTDGGPYLIVIFLISYIL